MFLDAGGRLIQVMTIDIADGVVQTVRSIINRDKLRHLGPLADLRGGDARGSPAGGGVGTG
jgi:RNA polymerase sigma-70 factor (ECF subfamily)